MLIWKTMYRYHILLSYDLEFLVNVFFFKSDLPALNLVQTSVKIYLPGGRRPDTPTVVYHQLQSAVKLVVRKSFQCDSPAWTEVRLDDQYGSLT